MQRDWQPPQIHPDWQLGPVQSQFEVARVVLRQSLPQGLALIRRTLQSGLSEIHFANQQAFDSPTSDEAFFGYCMYLTRAQLADQMGQYNATRISVNRAQTLVEKPFFPTNSDYFYLLFHQAGVASYGWHPLLAAIQFALGYNAMRHGTQHYEEAKITEMRGYYLQELQRNFSAQLYLR
jgi:hypothetical protein